MPGFFSAGKQDGVGWLRYGCAVVGSLRGKGAVFRSCVLDQEAVGWARGRSDSAGEARGLGAKESIFGFFDTGEDVAGEPQSESSPSSKSSHGARLRFCPCSRSLGFMGAGGVGQAGRRKGSGAMR